MSIKHSYLIGQDAVNELVFNISGLDSESKDVSSLSATIFAHSVITGESRFTCNLSIDNLRGFYQHLSQYHAIRDNSATSTGRFIEVIGDHNEIMKVLEHSENASLILALQHIISNRLTNGDINTILGRKDALAEYEAMLNNAQDYKEGHWQAFFERNEWIFGYGLRYKYLKILQREAHVAGADVSGLNSVITDFLISDSRFTKIVELKTPMTKLFSATQNRSDSWRLSNDLTDAVSQILTQKANWEIKSLEKNYTSDDSLITEETYDTECILIIGSLSGLEGTPKELAIKRKTLELYRRNMKNIDILFYDELLERAKFIVQSAEVLEGVKDSVLKLP